jgi:hypothetical protein
MEKEKNQDKQDRGRQDEQDNNLCFQVYFLDIQDLLVIF